VQLVTCERVADAAKSIGLHDWFAANNSFLSKFAHPTALVLGIMHQSEALRTLQALLTTNGVYFAGQCVIALEEIVAKIPAAAYPTVLIVIWGGMPDEKRIAFQLESECGGFCVARKGASS